MKSIIYRQSIVSNRDVISTPMIVSLPFCFHYTDFISKTDYHKEINDFRMLWELRSLYRYGFCLRGRRFKISFVCTEQSPFRT